MKRNIYITVIICAAALVLTAGVFFLYFSDVFPFFNYLNKPVVTVHADNIYNETLHVVTDMDYEPFSYIGDDGEYLGLDVELIAEIANRLHMNLDLKLLNWTEANELFLMGKADAMLNMETDFLFQDKRIIATIPTAEKQYVVYGRQPVSSVPELYGKKVASLHELYALGLGDGIKYINSYAKIFQALKSGEFDFAVCPIQVGNVFLEKLDIKDVRPSYAVGHVYGAIALLAKNTDLKKRLDAIISDMQREGRLDALDKKWVRHRYYNLSFIEMLKERPEILMILIVIILSIIFLFFYLTLQTKHLKEKDAYSKNLLIAKEKAEESSRAKSVFLSTMSHEIRTPINAVLGMNEMIIRAASNKNLNLDILTQIKDYAGNVERAGKNLLSIINDILDFSKIEAGKMEVIPANYKLSSVLNDVANMIMFRAHEKGLDFTIDVDGDLPDDLFGDEVRIKQALTNVLSNAVKYTNDGSVSFSVRGEKIFSEKNEKNEKNNEICMIFSVADTGVGIKQEDIAKLFDKFERMDLSKNKTVEGTGLGLAITKNLLELMNGDISVESEYGKGSIFTITIPQKIISDEKIGNFREKFENAIKRAEYRESFIAPEARILVVDDTEMNLTVVKGLLEKTEIHIDTVLSGADALNMTKRIKYDLILMDQMMPNMSGTETLQNIKNQKGGLNIDTPVICLTADAIMGAREKYLEQGFIDYLSKPIEGIYLEKTLIKYLPADKITVQHVSEGENTNDIKHEPSELEKFYKKVPDLNFDNAVKVCSNEDILGKTLKQFYISSEENIADIQRFFNEKDYRNYTIKVHALKSSARLIGADALSQEAMYLENCGNDLTEANLNEIDTRTPPLLDEYKKLRTALSELYQEKEEDAASKPEMRREDLYELYGLIKQFAEEFNIDAIDELLEEATKYKIPADEDAKFKKISKAANNMDWSALEEALKR